jgi:hypothetical protein
MATSIAQTSAATAKVEAWLAEQQEARVVTFYIGQGAPRFFLAMSPELPDPSFAKIVVLTGDDKERKALKFRLRQAVADGLAPEARVRVTQIVFGPPSPFPVAYRVMGPDPDKLRDIAAEVRGVMQASAQMRTVNTDWGERVPTLHFSLDQDRLQSIGLTSAESNWLPYVTSRTRRPTRSPPRSLLSIARLNMARPRTACSFWRWMPIAQMSLGLSGAFCPTNFPLFHASRCGCSRVSMIGSLLLIGVRFLNSQRRTGTGRDAEGVLSAKSRNSPKRDCGCLNGSCTPRPAVKPIRTTRSELRFDWLPESVSNARVSCCLTASFAERQW